MNDICLNCIRSHNGNRGNSCSAFYSITVGENEDETFVLNCTGFKLKNNDIDKPDHYIEGRTIEPIEVIEDWKLCHHLACALKYISRIGRKEDDEKDIEKAIWYLKRYKKQIKPRKNYIIK